MATKSEATEHKTPTKPERADYQKLTAEGIATEPTPESLALQRELDDLGKPGRVSKADGEFIDNAPGYSKNQLAHMREYYGLKDDASTADVAPV